MFSLYLTKDLFFASRVLAAARAHGGELRVVGSVDDLLQAAANADCPLVLLDLDTPGADVQTAVAGLRAKADRAPKIIAFGSHVHEARLEAARQAGCDRVLTRGQFDRQMAQILRKHL